MSNPWGVVGHDWAVDQLREGMLHGRIGQAYLLTGPAHVGRSTLARMFAQALNCHSEPVENRPCGVCRPCQLIAGGRHPDVRTVEPEVSGRGQATMKIDQIRELQRFLNVSTVEGRYKVAILRRFDAANASAANAFLKTLEEPPPHSILLLTAAEADSMLPTISSRCRTMALRPVPAAKVTAALIERWQVAPQTARLLAHIANGRMGWAVRAAEDETVLAAHQQQIGLLVEALNERRVGRFTLAGKLAKEAETLPDLLQTWSSWWRDAAVMSWGGDGQAAEALINIDLTEEIAARTTAWAPEAILSGLKQTNEAVRQLSYNANTKLVIENLLLTYPLPV